MRGGGYYVLNHWNQVLESLCLQQYCVLAYSWKQYVYKLVSGLSWFRCLFLLIFPGIWTACSVASELVASDDINLTYIAWIMWCHHSFYVPEATMHYHIWKLQKKLTSHVCWLCLKPFFWSGNFTYFEMSFILRVQRWLNQALILVLPCLTLWTLGPGSWWNYCLVTFSWLLMCIMPSLSKVL